jgi:superfamily I DNA/RNA helicase
MRATRSPFLVRGNEDWLKSFAMYNGQYRDSIAKLRVSINASGNFSFYLDSKSSQEVPFDVAERAISKLGSKGAYTHELGRYWALRTLRSEPHLVTLLARKFPQILIDEAQDVGTAHGAILDLLRKSGTVLTVIGDPNQAIYDFADADGTWLQSFGVDGQTRSYGLTQNRRSVDVLVQIANKLANTSATSVRKPPSRRNGAYIVKYSDKDVTQLAANFRHFLSANGYTPVRSRIICRGNSLIPRLMGSQSGIGTGATRDFLAAAMSRDFSGDMRESFRSFADGVSRVLENVPHRFVPDLMSVGATAEMLSLRRLLWRFLQSPESGLPGVRDVTAKYWHGKLKERLPLLLSNIEKKGFRRLGTWANNVTQAQLGDTVLMHSDRSHADGLRIRTVHQVKGESLEAVLWVLNARDVGSLLQGTATSEGRIGYVATTRAEDLLIIGVPDNCDKSRQSRLAELGFVPLEDVEWSRAGKSIE